MMGRFMLLLACLLCAPAIQAAAWSDWWLTPDQQGQRLFNNGDFAAAAEIYEDAARKGAAYYRAGDFENAASVFGRIRTPEAAFNRGNALIMLGRYKEAIGSFDRALELRPGWAEAEQNRDLARVRLEMLAPPDSDAGGTGGKLGADKIVFDDTGRVKSSDQEQVTEETEMMTDEEMRSVWLRRVQNDPADFLRTRFSYQLYREQQQEEVNE
mgnify:CR=1 FL=1|jgi:Ca-activated chloride channel family protein